MIKHVSMSTSYLMRILTIYNIQYITKLQKVITNDFEQKNIFI